MNLIEDFKKELGAAKKLSKLKMEYIVDLAYKFVKEYLVENNKAKVKSHQLRRFLNAIKGVKVKVDRNKSFSDLDKIKILMLRPQFENARAKEPKLIELSNICSEMIKYIKDIDDFYVFANFFESVVAFHKPYEK
jgi:CRISPR type III-A-associated protein Csm2